VLHEICSCPTVMIPVQETCGPSGSACTTEQRIQKLDLEITTPSSGWPAPQAAAGCSHGGRRGPNWRRLDHFSLQDFAPLRLVVNSAVKRLKSSRCPKNSVRHHASEANLNLRLRLTLTLAFRSRPQAHTLRRDSDPEEFSGLQKLGR
jgi:hypothetical protein